MLASPLSSPQRALTHSLLLSLLYPVCLNTSVQVSLDSVTRPSVSSAACVTNARSHSGEVLGHPKDKKEIDSSVEAGLGLKRFKKNVMVHGATATYQSLGLETFRKGWSVALQHLALRHATAMVIALGNVGWALLSDERSGHGHADDE